MNLEAAEIWFYRKMQRYCFMAKKTNKQVLIQINQDKSLFKTIKSGNSNVLDTLSGQNN